MNRYRRHQRPLRKRRPRFKTSAGSFIRPRKTRSRNPPDSRKRTRPRLRQDFDKSPALIEGMERVLCPRVHFKIIVFDLKAAYVGSANLTGAGLGMKGENTRNLEAVILSTNKDFVKNAAE